MNSENYLPFKWFWPCYSGLKTELCRLGPCGPRHLWKTRKASENWRHLSRSDLRNHVWVTRGYFCLLGKLASWAPLSFHQIRCIEIQVPKPTSSKCKYTSLEVAADGVWSGLVANHRLSHRCKQQSLRSECHTSLNSTFTALTSTFTSERVQGPFWPDKTGCHDLTSLSILFQALLVLFLSLPSRSVFGWWFFFLFF